jgi:hypothetical protein
MTDEPTKRMHTITRTVECTCTFIGEGEDEQVRPNVDCDVHGAEWAAVKDASGDERAEFFMRAYVVPYAHRVLKEWMGP